MMTSKGRVKPLEMHPRRVSYRNSSFSLSASELNEAIFGMLRIHTQNQKCTQKCVGNPLTTGGQRIQLIKMLAIALLPLVILTSITIVDFSKSLTGYQTTENIINNLDFAVVLGDFLTALQKERDMSSLYVSKIGPDTKNDLLLVYPETDEALDLLTAWPVSPNNNRRELQTRERYSNYINKHRYELDSVNSTVTAEIDFYSQDIETFIRWMYDAVGEAESSVIWKSLVGYQELIMASEYIGRERGYGIYFYATGKFRDINHYLLFAESQDIAMTFFESARQYSVVAYDMYQEELASSNETIQVITSMRLEVRSNKSSKPEGSVSLAKWWFANMSVYRDVMKVTQKKLTSKISVLLKAKSNQDMVSMLISGAICLAVFIVSPVIAISVYQLTYNIQQYSKNIAKKTKALNREKKQSEAILCQMLPKSIAESLKQNETVNAEQFDECTILQSDMVGFTRLASTCSPGEVTQLLNHLFTCFDNRIAIYDVYKVETIGDGYMVTSGVPRRNGNRHSSEIATLSLDLLHHVQHLDMVQRPGERYMIRIGCHSGPVLAGVVGYKNPRYCLFGSTVRMAALMESSGRANSIQISHTTFKNLVAIGGYGMEDRLIDDVLQNDLKVLGMAPMTYWLNKKEGLEFLSGFESSEMGSTSTTYL